MAEPLNIPPMTTTATASLGTAPVSALDYKAMLELPPGSEIPAIEGKIAAIGLLTPAGNGVPTVQLVRLSQHPKAMLSVKLKLVGRKPVVASTKEAVIRLTAKDGKGIRLVNDPADPFNGLCIEVDATAEVKVLEKAPVPTSAPPRTPAGQRGVKSDDLEKWRRLAEMTPEERVKEVTKAGVQMANLYAICNVIARPMGDTLSRHLGTSVEPQQERLAVHLTIEMARTHVSAQLPVVPLTAAQLEAIRVSITNPQG
jgi:hypothetical protein